MRLGRHCCTECFMYFSAHVLTHFSSVAVSALLRKETTHSLKQRSTSPLNMRSVSFSCISSSFCSIAVTSGNGSGQGHEWVCCCRREAHPASQLQSPGPGLLRWRSCRRSARSANKSVLHVDAEHKGLFARYKSYKSRTRYKSYPCPCTCTCACPCGDPPAEFMFRAVLQIMRAAPRAAAEPPTVLLQRSAETPVEVLVIHKTIVVGRAPSCDARIEHPQISARHCM